MGKESKYAVVGNPVAHSLSPEIHEAFAKQFGDNISYEKIEIPLGEFESYIEDLISEGYKGVNVTIPFKVDAYRFSTKTTAYARQATAANTLKFEGNKVLGENTDGIGFVQDLKGRLNFSLKNKNILILGAGEALEDCSQSFLTNFLKRFQLPIVRLLGLSSWPMNSESKVFCTMRQALNNTILLLTPLPQAFRIRLL